MVQATMDSATPPVGESGKHRSLLIHPAAAGQGQCLAAPAEALAQNVGATDLAS